MAPRVDVMRRVSTRPPRQGDDEVDSVTWQEFERQVQDGRFALSWVRPVRGGEAIGYGCLRPSPGVVPVFMAGHGVYSNAASVRPVDVLETALLVGVAAPAEVRRTRLIRRSPDVAAAGEPRVSALMAHDDEAMLRHVHIAIDNALDEDDETVRIATGVTKPAAVTDAVRVISYLIDTEPG